MKVTRGSSQWRLDTWGKPCKPTIVAMPIYSGGPRFQANVLVRPAFIMLGAVFMKNSYIIRSAGCYNCRSITGGTSYSSHSWGIAVDVNADTNPYRHDKLITDMKYSMIKDVYEIKTIDGVQVFRWGGDWDGRPEVPNSNYDAMHFECIATPQELARGFSHDVPDSPDTPIHYPVIRIGSRGPVVIQLQLLLKMEGTTGDGIFGPRTDAAVRRFQAINGLTVDGIVGAATWTLLLKG